MTTLAIIIVVAAFLSLVLILRSAVSRSLEISASANRPAQIQPVDVEAFRNLVDPAEEEYLRRRLPASHFRRVRRARLHATSSYVRAAGRNAAVLVRIGESALSTGDPRIAQAARALINDALMLRRNATFALIRIHIALAFPRSGLAAAPIIEGYKRLSISAMLLGRLQNPATPVRVAAL
jgi:hypothetical protein